MQRPKREIVLFCEENEDVDNISSNLVRLYMNRLVIEEEEQLEIIGNFNLTRVKAYSPKRVLDRLSNNTKPAVKSLMADPEKLSKTYLLFKKLQMLHIELINFHLRKNLIDRLSAVNWNKDKLIIENALNELQVFNKRHIETHIIIGSSLYFDHLKTFDELISDWNNKILKMNGPEIEATYGTYEPYNQLTLLNGWKRTAFSTKNQVKQAYQKNYHLSKLCKAKSYRQNTSSLSPDLVMMSVNDDLERMIARNFRPVYTRKEYIKTFLFEMQGDDEFLKSDCERLTVALY